MLDFQTPPEPEGLLLSLSVRLRWYRRWRARGFRRWWRHRGRPRLFERAPLDLLPAVPVREGSLRNILRSSCPEGLWHLQIRTRRWPGPRSTWLPRYYARARFREGQWRTLWIGERWLAGAVHAAIRRLDEDESDLPDSGVRVVSSRAYQFTTLWIEEVDRHLVAHASAIFEGRLPRLEYLSGEALQQRLLERFGDRFERTGIG